MTTQLITIDQAAARLSMSKAFIRARIADGSIPALKIGRSVRIALTDLDAYLERQRRAA
jgi:excisionase family DNA binding protein